MTDRPVPLFTPPEVPLARQGPGLAVRRGPLPVVALVGPRLRSTVYGLATVDNRGRLADRSIVAAMGWKPGVRLAMQVRGGSVLVRESAEGRCAVSRRGYVHLPATVRRACGVYPGDRVLLAANPTEALLLVYPPTALDTILALQREVGRGGGDPE